MHGTRWHSVRWSSLAVSIWLLVGLVGCGGGVVTPGTQNTGNTGGSGNGGATIGGGSGTIPPPSINSVAPGNGPASGGTPITISGSAFHAQATVLIGGQPPASTTFVNSSSIQAVTAGHAAGSVDVQVTNPDMQRGIKLNAFTFDPIPAPFITTVSPNNGLSSGGTLLTINGGNFVSGATVLVGGAMATMVTLVNSSQLTALTPGGSGTVDVQVRNPDGQVATLGGSFTYTLAAPPNLISLNPTFGPSAGGTSVTLTGTDFVVGAAVVFGGVNSASVTVVSSTQITAVTPPHAPGVTSVVVRNPDNQTDTLASGFRFDAAPSINTVTPSSGASTGGTTVTINGANFNAAATVRFGGILAASVTVVSSTQIQAVTPAAAAGPVGVTVTNPDGQSATLAGSFTFTAPPPTVTAPAPVSGPQAGGTTVIITGTNFQPGAIVRFGLTLATSVTVNSATQITAVTPPAAAPGSVNVQVTNPDGLSGVDPNGFTYLAPPTVLSVAPSMGTTAGGTVVVISGTDFQAGATVTFGPNAATGVVVSSSTMILATTPMGTSGSVNVTVRNPDNQTDVLTNGFTYAAAPIVTAVNPNNGPAAGGTAVTISGTGFLSGATVRFGGTLATGVVFNSSTSLSAVTPAGAPGLVDVTVTNPGGQSGTLMSAFSYTPAVAPVVSSVNPNSGPLSGGTLVTVNGSNFQAGATVTFDGVSGTSVMVLSSTQIRVLTPAGTAGPADVQVTNPDLQTNTLLGGFTYNPPPTVTGVNPSTGVASGGTIVTISGTNFQNGAMVLFGGVNSPGVVFVSSTQLSATTPARAPGTVGVRVTNPDGQSFLLNSAFTYQLDPPPVVANVLPNSAPTTGVNFDGTTSTATVFGSNFLPGASVFLGGVASMVTGVSPTQISIQTPVHTPGTFDVEVRNPDGQNAVLPNSFTFILAPSVTSVLPGSGPTAGGTTVLVNGSNFITGAVVLFGTLPATLVSFVSPTQLQAVTPAASAGTVSVRVVNPDAQVGILLNGFTFTVALPAPTVTTVSPNSGPDTGGTVVNISGTNFRAGATVDFGGVPAIVTNVTSSQISVITPPHAAGAVDVSVNNTDGQSATLPTSYAFLLTSLPGIVRPPLPALPQATVDVSMPDTTGYALVTISDTGNPDMNGANFQAAINNASCSPNGTIIELIAGATYRRTNNFTLPAKACAAGKWVIIRTQNHASLPSPGIRVTPGSDGANMPIIRLVSSNIPGIRAESAARRYRLIGLRVMTPASGGFNSSEPFIAIGRAETTQDTLAEQADEVIVDRSILQGSDSLAHEIVGGVEFHCRNCAVVDSHMDQIHRIGLESQGIRGWNGQGPVLVENNRIEAAGMCMLIGGADPAIPNVLLSDITFRRNYCFKPLSWRVGHPTYAGIHWLVKNQIELKHGVRVLLEGNVFENVWPDAQAGAGILFNTSNSSRTPWAQVSDVTFRYNRSIRAEGGPLEIGGWNNIFSSPMTQRIHIHDNIFEQQGGASRRYLLISSSTPLNQVSQLDAITIEHNTILVTTAFPNVSGPVAVENSVPAGFRPFLQGIAIHNNIFATGRSPSEPAGVSENCKIGGVNQGAFGCYTVDSWHKNLVYHTNPVSTWCRNNSDFSPWANHKAACVNTVNDVRFVDLANGDFTLALTSPGKGNSTTPGVDVGANFQLVTQKTQDVRQ